MNSARLVRVLGGMGFLKNRRCWFEAFGLDFVVDLTHQVEKSV